MSNAFGILKLRNASGAIYLLEELGVTLSPGEEIDILDEALPSHYDHYDAARSAVRSLTSCQLCQDVAAGKIVVTEETPPPPSMEVP